MEKRNLRKVGSEYEQLAVDYLREKGYRILARNYRIRQSEIDIIAMEDRTVVFVEVKYRNGHRTGYGTEAVTPGKQQRISRAALHYLMEKGLWEKTACRFDVILVENKRVTHLVHAFDYRE